MSRKGGRGPRKLGGLIREVAAEVEPGTPLARVQAAWADAAGLEFAARCRPTAERQGVVTVVCESAVWAQELDLRQVEIVDRLRADAKLSGLSKLKARVGDPASDDR